MTIGGGFLDPTAAGPTRTRASERALDPLRDKAVAQAVLHVLAEVGFRGFTMDEVAMAAGVSKATIYRRWSSKVELLVSFLEVAQDTSIVTTDTGSLRGDLLAFTHSVAGSLEGPTGRALKALLGQLAEEPALADAYRRGPLSRWDGTVRDILGRAVQRGEVEPGVAASLAVEAGPGILLQFWFLRDRRLDEATVTGIVDEVMLPLLTMRTTDLRRAGRLPPT